MTIEEAIKHCEEVAAGKTEQGKCPGCAADHKQLAEWLREFVTLRAQQTPLDRSRWEGCKLCKGAKSIYGCDITAFCGTSEDGTANIYTECEQDEMDFDYCPNCGRPLTEEAWAELERRINGGTTD